MKEYAEKIKALPKDEQGVFIMTEINPDRYEAGISVYPVYMEYETKYNKKEGYTDIVAQLKVLAAQVREEYSTMQAAKFLTILTDTLAVTSPEIYEHYCSLQNLLKETAALFIQKEQIVMTAFPTEQIKSGLEQKDTAALKLAGGALLKACEHDFLSAEKYGAMGKELSELV